MPKPPKRFLPATASYQVGYCKPPAEQRFKKGVSGNPRGRPRGAKNKRPGLQEERLKKIIQEEAYRTINVTDSGRPITISMATAVMRSIALTAAKGDPRSQRLFTDILWRTEKSNRDLYDKYLKSAVNYKASWEAELERRARLGIVAPDPIPHPKDIIIDRMTGAVQIWGPVTKEEKPEWDYLRNVKNLARALIAENEQILSEEPNCEDADELRRQIAEAQEVIDDVSIAIKD